MRPPGALLVLGVGGLGPPERAGQVGCGCERRARGVDPAGEPRGDLLDQPGIAVRIGEGEERPVAASLIASYSWRGTCPASTPRLVQILWPASRSGVPRAPTASTRSVRGGRTCFTARAKTGTGPAGMPPTWWPNRPGRTCQRDRSRAAPAAADAAAGATRPQQMGPRSAAADTAPGKPHTMTARPARPPQTRQSTPLLPVRRCAGKKQLLARGYP